MTRFWQRLSQRERALVGLTAAILIIFFGKYLVISPFLERREAVQNELETQPQLLEKNLRYLGQKEVLAASLESVRNEIKARETKLLTGDTPSVSASDLQDTVQGMATREGTQVITTRVLNPEPAGPFSKISIQMEVGGQIDQIASLIRSLEASPKYIVLEEINVRSLFRPIGLPQPQGLPQAPAQNLRVSLTVAGYARAQPASTGKPGEQKETKAKASKEADE